jgi:alcohol dehydrogenase (cytochrome c)
MLAAVTTTSTELVFTGELSRDFLVLDGRDGRVLYRHDTGGAVNGGIVTYEIDGKQHVAVTSGTATYFWGAPVAPATVTIFALPAPDR